MLMGLQSAETIDVSPFRRGNFRLFATACHCAHVFNTDRVFSVFIFAELNKITADLVINIGK